ncbi:MAG TPA: hypothetical protein VMT55_02950, partial [Candidatus Sulfotelmatobacter sp.]|nr:hypothetical protein [Candidatus Sulfotelmatobacter sp.]
MRGLVAVGFVLLIFSPAVFADQADIPVELKADKLKYFEDSPIVEASGSVEARLKEVTIFADRLRFDSATNIVTAEGNVRLTGAAYQAAAGSLTYDASREISSFGNFRSSVQPATARAPFYLTARQMTERDNEMTGQKGTATTCEDDDPHWLMTADRIGYYPDDRIEGWNTVMYVGNLPVLWLPYLRYDLSKQKKRNWSFGHNNVEGDYIKSAWSYSGGTLLLDAMSNKGFGYGTEVGYGLAALGAGTLYLYHLDERDTGTADWVTKISDEKKLNDTTTLKFSQGYTSTYLVPGGRLEQTTGTLGLNGSGPDPWDLTLNALDDRGSQTERYSLQYDKTAGQKNLNYYNNYEFSKTSPNWINQSQRLALRAPLFSDNTQLNITADYYHRVNYTGDPGEEKVTPQLEITGRETNFAWRYTQNWFVDLRQDISPGVPRYEFLEKQPEIEIAPRSLDLNFFNLSSKFVYGNYREVKTIPETGAKRDFTTSRYQATLNADKSVPLILGTNLSLGAGVDQFLYGPGDELFGLRENAALHTDLLSFFRNDLTYNHGYNEGNSPFFFDKLN